MLKILIIASTILFILWLFTELFKKKKKNAEKENKKSSSLLYLFILLAVILLVIIVLPRLGLLSSGVLNKLFMPLFSILKNFIPF